MARYLDIFPRNRSLVKRDADGFPGSWLKVHLAMRSPRIAPAFLFREGRVINPAMSEAPQEIEITLLSSAMTSDDAEVVSLIEAQLDEHAIPRPEGSGGIAAVVRGMAAHPERGFILVAKEKRACRRSRSFTS